MVMLGACAKRPRPAFPEPPAAPATPPPAPAPQESPAAPPVDEYTRLQSMSTDELDRLGLFQNIQFDFDQFHIRDDAKALLVRNAEVLRQFEFLRVTVEGHCDARGTVEYNLALGERRATAVYDYLVSLGVPRDHLRAVSYGKEAPLCSESSEECWARNRRARLGVSGKATDGR
jgi:peptidoglycan-associated lipoprotein